MRVSRPVDRISDYALWLGGAGGVLVFMAALPFALSNPFPTPRQDGWIIEYPPFDARPAAAAVTPSDRPLVFAALDDPGDRALTFAERWNSRVPQAAMAAAAMDEAPPDAPADDDGDLQEAGEDAGEALPTDLGVQGVQGVQVPGMQVPPSLALPPPDGPPPGGLPTDAVRKEEPGMAAAPAERRLPPVRPAAPQRAVPAPAAPPSPQDAVDRYLWQVYQRRPVKSDSTGNFTWKDQAAARRLGMSLKSYVIGGLDPDFREQLYHAGHAMDADGLQWSMLSAFRDDYRQSLAAGFKAHGGNSQHGGSRATGGYGFGRAIDITSADGDGDAVWHWVDVHGAKYGLQRPMTWIDPAHIQAARSFHDLGHALREARLRLEEKLSRSKVARSEPCRTC